VFNQSRNEAIVWDPTTGERLYTAAPPEFDKKGKYVLNGAVLCAATDEAHVHGDCHSSPFQLVLIGIHFAAFYSSQTGLWGDIISIERRPIYSISMELPSTLIGNSLYWLFNGEVEGILEFDLAMQSLAAIDMPSEFEYYSGHRSFQILPADDGGIGLVILSHQILGLDRMGGWENLIKAYAEDFQFIFIRTVEGVFMIHLESMQFKNLGKDNFDGFIHPYSAFCTAGMACHFAPATYLVVLGRGSQTVIRY
jgi:hypothetical protein